MSVVLCLVLFGWGFLVGGFCCLFGGWNFCCCVLCVWFFVVLVFSGFDWFFLGGLFCVLVFVFF